MPEDEKPHIKPGMKLRVVSDRGIGAATRFYDAESGEEFMPSGVAYPVKIDISDARSVNIELTMARVPVDLVGTVIGMKMTEDTHCIEYDPDKYDAVITERKDGMKRVYFERKR